MPTATVTSKGQVTIPNAVREELGINTGTKLLFVQTSQGYLLRAANNSVMRLSGSLKYDGPPVSLEEMDEAISVELADKDRRVSREWSAGQRPPG